MSQSGQRLLTATEKVLRVGCVRDIYTFVAAAAVRLHLFKIYKEIYIVQEAWHLQPRYQLWSTVRLSVL